MLHIRMVFVYKWSGLKEILLFFDHGWGNAEMTEMAKFRFSRLCNCVKNRLDFSKNDFLVGLGAQVLVLKYFDNFDFLSPLIFYSSVQFCQLSILPFQKT